MRTRILPSCIAGAVVAAGWFLLNAGAGQVQARLELAQAEHRDLTAARAEHERLLAAQPDAAHMAALRAAAGEHAQILREIDARKAVASSALLRMGEWAPSHAWENRGLATPRAAVETALWAAAGGDVTTLAATLKLEAEAREKAEALLARLPTSARSTYTTPEALIAGATMKNIPLAQAQMVWFHEADADHAAVGLLLQKPESTEPASVSSTPPPRDDRAKPNMVTLTLHRSEAGWQLVVPARAVDRIDRELTARTTN